MQCDVGKGPRGAQNPEGRHQIERKKSCNVCRRVGRYFTVSKDGTTVTNGVAGGLHSTILFAIATVVRIVVKMDSDAFLGRRRCFCRQ